jgi:hypothetical protein
MPACRTRAAGSPTSSARLFGWWSADLVALHRQFISRYPFKARLDEAVAVNAEPLPIAVAIERDVREHGSPAHFTACGRERCRVVRCFAHSQMLS